MTASAQLTVFSLTQMGAARGSALVQRGALHLS